MKLPVMKMRATVGNSAWMRMGLPALCGFFLLLGVSPKLQATGLEAPPTIQSTALVQTAAIQKNERPSRLQSERKEEIHQKQVDNPEAEEGENVYRHSPMVHTLAHLFGLSVESTSRLFETINFIVLVAAIFWFVARFLPKTLRGRTQRIQNELQQARSATEDANRRLENVEQRLSHLDSEINALKEQAEHETVAEEQRLRTALEQEKQLILESATQDIAAAGMNAQRQLKNLAAELVIEHARKRIAVTPEADRSLVENFLADLNKKSSRERVN